MVQLATHEWPPGADATEASPPLAVLVHGVTGWWRTWWRVGPALADAGWRVVAVDQRGHGHSPRLGGPVTVVDLAGDLAMTIEAIGRPVDLLIGHSLGGAVAAEVAVDRPDLVQRLVLEDPPAISRVGDDAWLTNVDGELKMAVRDPEGEIRRTIERNPTWLTEDARQDVEGKQLADRIDLIASFRAGIGTRVLDLLPRLTVPSLLLLADERRSVFPPVARRELAERRPAHVRQVVVASGHTIHRDLFDDYLALILDWAGAPSSRG
jgi:pimeloyl-ACP methyl ester carboxylesterase